MMRRYSFLILNLVENVKNIEEEMKRICDLFFILAQSVLFSFMFSHTSDVSVGNERVKK